MLLFFVKDSNTNSMLVFNKLLPQLRANLGPLKVPKTDPTGPPEPLCSDPESYEIIFTGAWVPYS